MFFLRESDKAVMPLSALGLSDRKVRQEFAQALAVAYLPSEKFAGTKALVLLCEYLMIDARKWPGDHLEALADYQRGNAIADHPEAQHVVTLHVISAASGLEIYAAPRLLGADGYFRLGEFEPMHKGHDDLDTIWQPVIDYFRSLN